ncbi:MAG: serine hydrolase domain-containing protein, partial [Acidimicrobiia bacterium]
MIDPELTDSFSGVVLVTRAGERLFAAVHGLANRAEAIPNHLDTRFAQASGTKTLTAIAVARLVEEGSFGFDTPMKDCLGLWPGGFDSGVTVHHLLSHTSG